MRFGEYVIRSTLLETPEHSIYLVFENMKTEGMTLFVYSQEFVPASPSIKIIKTFKSNNKFCVLTEQLDYTLEMFIKENKDHADWNTFTAVITYDLLSDLQKSEFFWFSLRNIFIQKHRNGSIKAKLGLNALADPEFNAPEGAQGKPAGIWGCGITLYWLVAKRSPYNGATPDDLAKRIKMFQVNIVPPTVDKLFKTLADEMLRFDAQRRVPLEQLLGNVILKQRLPARDW